MIKLDRENWKIETDCRTVGEFMTEAAAIFDGNVTVIVDGCRYDLFDNHKLRVADSTPIDTGSTKIQKTNAQITCQTNLSRRGCHLRWP